LLYRNASVLKNTLASVYEGNGRCAVHGVGVPRVVTSEYLAVVISDSHNVFSVDKRIIVDGNLV
jgi:hypothetical protein